MIVNPRVGSTVQIWYGAKTRDRAPLHGKVGVVKVASKGKPRNHGVLIEGKLYVVPCRQIQEAIRPVAARPERPTFLPGF